MEDLYVNPRLTIPSDYIRVTTSRSSGPGGQHVNKLNTRVSLFIDIQSCPCFTEHQKHILSKALKNRIDKQGVLQVSSQRHRSQIANRNAALERLAELIAAALKPKRKRKKTKIPKKAIRNRLEDKRARSKLRRLRSGPIIE